MRDILTIESTMATNQTVPSPMPARRSIARHWPWLILLGGLAWTIAIRVPLIGNAVRHLDSDLAVDGLTLLDASKGHWRWHYPGTPHMGSAPLLLSYIQARRFGATPEALVSGGTVAWALVVVSSFLLANRVYGARVACWSLVPLVFSSTGAIWLSGRITGGHLLTLAWHLMALVLFVGCLRGGGRSRPFLLGIWCGLGLWLDTMFAFTMLGLAAGAFVAWRGRQGQRPAWVLGLCFSAGLILGVLPKIAGRLVDPYDAYGEQFKLVLDPHVLVGHIQLLVHQCLPRLIAGHRLPDGRMLMGAGERLGRPGEADAVFSVLGIVLFGLACLALGIHTLRTRNREQAAIGTAILVSSALIGSAFVVNRNIFNSDNYRYLVFWIVAWSMGFGLLIDGLARIRFFGRPLAVGTAVVWMLLGSIDVARWYVEHRWVDESFRLVRGREAQALASNHPGATHVFGDYWHVYRSAFLSGGRVVAVPSPRYPDRFPGWSKSLDPTRDYVVTVDRLEDPIGLFEAAWVKDGGPPGAWRGVRIIGWNDPAFYFTQ
jgi:hypothetical protein